ncbi:putative phage tail protein [Paenibacillus popilliae]|uniref:DUF2313 domain-containing protein n=1 Tax=Paenibacillus popilliae ATCC 14706 TaxID=1212764 RepID=M9L9U1_PAEPP|nr:putative phage tail protein [Paenibacillus popilliae]GAC42267.1 hypothetical protein PPOP_1624 [Paenibacillus popilliae ATCC 14706]
MANRILKHLPEFYGDIEDLAELADTESIELNALEGKIHQLFADQFVLTSSIEGIRRREAMLSIQADPATESFEFRRQRIINRYQMKPPFSVRFLQQQLDALVGKGRTVVSLDDLNYTMTITTSTDDAPLFREVEHSVGVVKPTNIVYHQNTALADCIKLIERIAKKTVIWNYKLDGSWSLGEKPFASFGHEEVLN